MDKVQLVTVFRKITPFLDLYEIYILSQLNKYFHAYFINSEIKYHINLKKLSQIVVQDLTEGNFKTILNAKTGINVSSLSEAIDSCRFASNILKNSCGSNGLDNWIVPDGGGGWTVENSWTFQNNLTCFVASNGYGDLKQTILLPQLGAIKRKLFVGLRLVEDLLTEGVRN